MVLYLPFHRLSHRSSGVRWPTAAGRPSAISSPDWTWFRGRRRRGRRWPLARALAAHAEVTVAFRRVTGPVANEPFDIVAIEPNGRGLDAPASRRALGRFIEERCSAYGTVLEGTWPMLGKLTAWCAQRGIPAVPIVERQSARALARADRHGPVVARATVPRDDTCGGRRSCIAGSDDLKATIVRRWRVEADRITVTGTGVDRARFTPRDQADARRRLGLCQSSASFWPAACSTAPADLAPVIQAVQRVGDPDLRLHVLGQGERRAGLERLAGPGSPVTFHGRVGDDLLPVFIAAADLCVAIEHPDGPVTDPASEAAFTVAECLVSGRPVAIASDGDHPPAGSASGLRFPDRARSARPGSASSSATARRVTPYASWAKPPPPRPSTGSSRRPRYTSRRSTARSGR